jgi:general secretion pathway protein D
MVLGMKSGRTELYVWLETGEFITYESTWSTTSPTCGRSSPKWWASGPPPASPGARGPLRAARRSCCAASRPGRRRRRQDVAELYYKCMNLLEVESKAPWRRSRRRRPGQAGGPDMTSCIFTLAHATDETSLAKVLEVQVDRRHHRRRRPLALDHRERPGARIQQMKAILEVLDKPAQSHVTTMKQHVLIEAKIVEVLLGNDMTSTIDWIYETLYSGANGLGTAMNNKVLGMNSGQLGMNLDYGKISSEHFTAKILPQLTKRKSRLVTSPTTMTLDGQQALIKIGDSVPTPGNTTITNRGLPRRRAEILEAKIRLDVTPTVIGNNMVNLDIKIQETSLGERVEYQTGFFANQTSTRESSNKVVMRDNETLIIGGLIKEDSKYNKSQVPLIGNIPLLKPFFSKESDLKSKRELLIFVSIKIIDSRSARRSRA